MKLSKRLKSRNILVIGDVMLDTYYLGDVKRISPEAPVPVFKKENERRVLGGAANVASNLIAAGQQVSMLTIIGKDAEGKVLLDLFEKVNVSKEFVLLSSTRHTTTKTRFLCQNNQQVLRLDIEDVDDITSNEVAQMLDILEENVIEFDLILLSDYLKGVLSFELTQGIMKIAKQYGIKVIVDVKDPKKEKYFGAYLLKPNLKEVRALTKMPAVTDAEIIEASIELCTSCNCEYVLTTCGDRGMILVKADGTSKQIACASKEVYDVTGAGDTVIAYLGACIVNGFDIVEAVSVANYAAGIQVSKVGTSTVYVKEVDEYIRENTEVHVSTHKTINWSDLRSLRSNNKNKSIVFTNGCFDILHIGHIRYLKKAASFGDILVVGVNSDISVRKLKGESRPINSQEERVELLAALEFIDYVIIFDEDTPYELIKSVEPDVLVKGADYKPEEVIGKDFVEVRGGRLELVMFVEGKSTSNIIGKIKGIESNENRKD